MRLLLGPFEGRRDLGAGLDKLVDGVPTGITHIERSPRSLAEQPAIRCDASPAGFWKPAHAAMEPENCTRCLFECISSERGFSWWSEG